ncbi:ArsR family transcriptional regulator [Leptospira langatensis]|uniref:ArsR family transcriptional regulator n=1 Tax=Leptospira langatensis TaxID=2484983 RepID=A0A5F1ZPZ2_9LEPT|nr:metalloregulator ArsR/SmtB family transcription factor [Leptospira langatensis]TGK05217.1 ArsR family transcriptional regulator [Leptospira langatensis]TGL38353.1 ArsR family transcriptional regulator [Leptospira langatensis]
MLNYSSSLDRIFYALSDPTRRGMIEQLSKKKASVSELASPLNMSMAAVVQHIQILEESGLIKTQKVGRVRSCQVEPRSFKAMESWLSQRRKFWERNLDRLDEYLDRLEKERK